MLGLFIDAKDLFTDAKELIGKVWSPLDTRRLALDELNLEGAEECQLESTAFLHEGEIPEKYTGEGENLSPGFEWNNPSREVAEWVLICEDADALRPEPFVHWIIYKIPGRVSWLPEGIAADYKPKLPFEALQAFNSRSTLGYTGPIPPAGHGTHHYHFQLFGLDKSLFAQATSKREIMKAIAGHVVAYGEIVGTYQRTRQKRN